MRLDLLDPNNLGRAALEDLVENSVRRDDELRQCRRGNGDFAVRPAGLDDDDIASDFELRAFLRKVTVSRHFRAPRSKSTRRLQRSTAATILKAYSPFTADALARGGRTRLTHRAGFFPVVTSAGRAPLAPKHNSEAPGLTLRAAA